MSAAAELEGLLNRLVDDQLDEAGTTRLQDVLRVDAAARRRYRQLLALHAGLQWDYVAAVREVQSLDQRWARVPVRRWIPWFGALAAALLFTVTLALWPGYAPPFVMTISSVSNGSLTWSDGKRQHALTGEDGALPGTLVLEGDSAIAMLRFTDGTSLMLAGEAELAVETQGGKHLDLRRGTLSAEVVQQPAGRPLVITTATARLEVLGTVFTVGTGVDATTLAVEQGRVRMERLADQQTVEVGAGQQASVSFDAAKRITVIVRPQVPSTWRFDFTQRPPAHWSGTWSAPADAGVGVFSATPYIAGRDAAGKPFIHHGVRVNAEQGTNRPFVRLQADSRLTMRFRLMRGDSRAQVKVMLCLMRDGAAFGGTFFAAIDPQALPVDAHGWRTAVLAMSAFTPTRPTVHPSPIGHSVTFILANTVTRPAGLEVASLAVDLP
jgi:ferric-dicitrate binding protein FerR (iron transport regulator)